MHAIVFQVTIHDQTEADRMLHEQFVPGMSGAPGFVAAYWVQTQDVQGTSVIVFDSEEAVRGVIESMPPPQTNALTVDSSETGPVVAHATLTQSSNRPKAGMQTPQGRRE